MKKILSFFVVFTLTVSTSNCVISCGRNFFSNDEEPQPPTPSPIVKDINYYQKKLDTSNLAIEDFKGNIEKMKLYKNDKDLFPTTQDYEKLMEQLNAELNEWLAISNESNYYILYLKYKGNFNEDEKVKAIGYLDETISNLEKELVVKKKYQQENSQLEINKIIKHIEEIKKEIIKYKNKEEQKW